jgi:FkbM family methyltransferase
MIFTDFEKYLKGKRGAFHVGAHLGEERHWYVKHGFSPVLYFEPNTILFPILEKNLKGFKNHTAYNVGVHDTITQTTLHISSNNGESSSILELGTHKIHHPKVHYIKNQEIALIRMDDFITRFNVDMEKFNFLNIDVQGVELGVIKSFGNLINKLDYIYTEVNEEYVYEGGCLIGEIDTYLKLFEFERVATHMTPYKWGDAFYIKKSLL